MKPFQQLLLALAGSGLLTQAAASAQESNAPIGSLPGTAALSASLEQQDSARQPRGIGPWESQDQVTSISQFSDVRPTDWAYQALSNLIERYGCVAGYPDGTYKGGRA